jgi:septum formation protein
LIASLGIAFEVIKPDIDESIRLGEDPFAYVERLSREKAAAVAGRVTSPPDPLSVNRQGESLTILAADTIVLAADTVGVTGEGGLLGKPADAAEAEAMLRRLRGDWHIVSTAFCLLMPEGSDTGAPARSVTGRVDTRVLMRPYTDAEIAAYIATGDPFDKAGAYAIQHPQFRPVARIEGCYNTVVGLPLCAVRRGLVTLGWPGITAAQGCDCPPFAESG